MERDALARIHRHYHETEEYAVAPGAHLARLQPGVDGGYGLDAAMLTRLVDPADPLVLLLLDGFCAEDVCDHLAARVAAAAGRPHGAVPDLRLLEAPSFFGVQTEDDRSRYYTFAAQCRQRLRTMSAPFESPFDRFERTLRRAWRGGLQAERLRDDTPEMAPFVVRRWLGGGKGVKPHVDRLSYDTDDSERAAHHAGQLGFNFVVASPLEGGETVVYDRAIVSKASYDAQRDRDGDGFSIVTELNEIARVRAPAGSVLFVSTQVVHSVEGPRQDRITISGFISVPSRRNQPLGIWG